MSLSQVIGFGEQRNEMVALGKVGKDDEDKEMPEKWIE